MSAVSGNLQYACCLQKSFIQLWSMLYWQFMSVAYRNLLSNSDVCYFLQFMRVAYIHISSVQLWCLLFPVIYECRLQKSSIKSSVWFCWQFMSVAYRYLQQNLMSPVFGKLWALPTEIGIQLWCLLSLGSYPLTADYKLLLYLLRGFLVPLRLFFSSLSHSLPASFFPPSSIFLFLI